MINTMKHLSLLGRMETDGLMLSLTGLFSENELDGACEKVERLELQVRLKKNRSSQIQRKLVECGEFADLYHAVFTDRTSAGHDALSISWRLPVQLA